LRASTRLGRLFRSSEESVNLHGSKTRSGPETDRRELTWVIGEPAIGKTALVAEHLQRNTDELTAIWLNCADWAIEAPNFAEILASQRQIGRRGPSGASNDEQTRMFIDSSEV
jgi:hypothetical protein